MKTRLGEVEILRGISFLAIVMQHTLAVFMYTPEITRAPALLSAVLLILIRYGVPTFVFITGLVLFYNHGEEDMNYLEFLKKRISLIFIPYLTWTLLYFAGMSLVYGLPADINSPVAMLGYLLKITTFGEGAYHLWFMVMIVQYYLFFPLFRAFVLKTQKRAMLTLSLCLGVYIGYLWLYHNGVGVLYEHVTAPWLRTLLDYRDRNFISWFFYFVLGSFAGLYIERFRHRVKEILVINTTVFFASAGWILYQIVQSAVISPAGGYVVNYQITLPLQVKMVPLLVSALFLVYYLSESWLARHRITADLLITFGRYSLGCYFIHAFLLTVISTLTKTYLHWLGTTGLILTSFTVCAAASLLACFLMSKLPCGRILVGKIPPAQKVSLPILD